MTTKEHFNFSNVAGIAFFKEIPRIRRLDEKIYFCAALKKCMEGKGPFLITPQEQSCPGGGYYLGLNEASEEYRSGKFHVDKLRMFETYGTAKRVIEATPRIEAGKVKSILLGPCNSDINYDVIVLGCNGEVATKIFYTEIFKSGKVMRGLAGVAACAVIAVAPYIYEEVFFTVGDPSIRKYMNLLPDQILIGFPSERAKSLMKVIKETGAS